MTTACKKISLLVLALSLAACGSNDYAKAAESGDFVTPLSTSEALISAVRLVVNSNTIATKNAYFAASTASSDATHKVSFFRNGTFAYSLGSINVSGVYQPSTNAYYLLNDTAKIAFIYSTPDPLSTWQTLANDQRDHDYAAVEAAYEKIKGYVGQDPAALGYQSCEISYSNIGDYLSYTALLKSVSAAGSLEEQYYFTLGKSGTGFAFSDYIYRKTLTTSEANAYSVNEYHFELVNVFPEYGVNNSAYRFVVGDNALLSVSSGDFLTSI